MAWPRGIWSLSPSKSSPNGTQHIEQQQVTVSMVNFTSTFETVVYANNLVIICNCKYIGKFLTPDMHGVRGYASQVGGLLCTV